MTRGRPAVMVSRSKMRWVVVLVVVAVASSGQNANVKFLQAANQGGGIFCPLTIKVQGRFHLSGSLLILHWSDQIGSSYFQWTSGLFQPMNTKTKQSQNLSISDKLALQKLFPGLNNITSQIEKLKRTRW